MHYKNGREAKDGDKVIHLSSGTCGLLRILSGQSQTTTAGFTSPGSPITYVTFADCLHIDDVVAAVIPDSTQS